MSAAGLKRVLPKTQFPLLALYRDILRAHQRHLPVDARVLGDSYVRTEFALHRDASADFKVQFERQWRDYLTTLKLQDPHADGKIGREMTPEEVGALSDEQKVQLLKIREEAKGPAKVS